MTWDSIQQVLRIVFNAIGGILVGKGYLTEDMSTTLIGALLSLGSVLLLAAIGLVELLVDVVVAAGLDGIHGELARGECVFGRADGRRGGGGVVELAEVAPPPWAEFLGQIAGRGFKRGLGHAHPVVARPRHRCVEVETNNAGVWCQLASGGSAESSASIPSAILARVPAFDNPNALGTKLIILDIAAPEYIAPIENPRFLTSLSHTKLAVNTFEGSHQSALLSLAV